MDPGGKIWILIAEKKFKASEKLINTYVGINQKPSIQQCGADTAAMQTLRDQRSDYHFMIQ